jgi:hypothetical protein
LARKPKYSERTCPSAALFTNLTGLDLGWNPDRRGVKPATNRLSYSRTVLEVGHRFCVTAFFQNSPESEKSCNWCNNWDPNMIAVEWRGAEEM